MPSGLYDYTQTPQGYGDTFFQYVYNGDTLVPGQNYATIGVRVNDGDFLGRQFSGQETIAQGNMNLYDKSLRQLFYQGGINFSSFKSPKAILPEVDWPANGNIRFDLSNAQPVVAGATAGVNVYASQLIFSGVRRRPNVWSDPAPSTFKYYEKVFSYPYQLSINNYAQDASGNLLPLTLNKINIQDFEFELRRIEMDVVQSVSPFKITLYDNNKVATSNFPVIANKFFHLNPALTASAFNFFPSPPIVYRIGSSIQFDTYSLLFAPTVLPFTVNLNFVGIRRIPC